MTILLHRYPVSRPGTRRFDTESTGISTRSVANNYERQGDYLGAGLVYAKDNDKNNALGCAKKCETEGNNLGAARIYFELGMRREAITHARKCTGPDAFKAAKLLLDGMETTMAKECADVYVKYIEGWGPDNTGIREKIPCGESATLLRIYSKAGDAKMAEQFTVPDPYAAKYRVRREKRQTPRL